ncbi:MAG: glutamate--tRNA ligase [Thermoproteota archaeon]|nr:glutamate--tRNA ligase [Candidatus Brockarchaeota archaeon]MBO3768222.1 glutamate--tRNA ligase [Candidatus Brockarchaeota archaeon]MBO3801022.1 glutamate--tRNA ligase [Candidatus Brockarchaeota archaeon]
MSYDEIRKLAFRLALENASKFGKAKPTTVIGHVLARDPSLKQMLKDVTKIVDEACQEVNSMSLEQIKLKLQESGPPPLVKKEPKKHELELPPNPEIQGYVLRFAPNPDGPLTLGNASPAILCSFFANKYKGKFILRFEDTSPSVKPPLLEAYNWVIEDLKWLGIVPDEIYYQSDRLEIYYDYAEKLIKMGNAYICTCKPEDFRKYIAKKQPCPHRDQSVETNLKLWSMMLEGKFSPGEAVLRVKTNLNHPNPAIRDWPALRVDLSPHPRVGNKYKVWPLYNWSCAIDDHEMGITHVIRGKEHTINEIRQAFVFNYFKWKKPITVNNGRVKLEGSVLSKSKIIKGIKSKEFLGPDDPRLGTIMAIRRRGFKPEVIKKIILELGLKPVEATLKWENIYAQNRVAIDKYTPRLFFVKDPVKVEIGNFPSIEEVILPNHPDNKNLGSRRIKFSKNEQILIANDDAKNLKMGEEIRLMNLFNIIVEEEFNGKVVKAKFVSAETKSRQTSLKLIQWVTSSSSMKTKVLMPNAEFTDGLAENNLKALALGSVVQFVRFGFVKIERYSDDYALCIFTHN